MLFAKLSAKTTFSVTGGGEAQNFAEMLTTIFFIDDFYNVDR